MLTTSLSNIPLLETSTVSSNNSYDVIIIGAGILGSSVANMLSKQQKRVLLVERDWKEPDRIVGELLQPGGVMALSELGLLDTLLDIDAIPNYGYTVFRNNQSVTLDYPIDKSPNVGYAFHHGKFIMKLRQAAMSSPNVTALEATAHNLLYNNDIVTGVSCSIRGISERKDYFAPLTIVADGCFSKFRKNLTTKTVTVKSNFVGVILKNVTLPFPNHGHVLLANPSPILLYQIGTYDIRVLVDIPGNLPSTGDGSLMKYMKEFVAPQMPESIQPAFLKALDSDRIRSMPCSWLPHSFKQQLGVITLGDAANMRHPLTGGGMTVALWDVVHLGNALKDFKDFKNVHQIKKMMGRFFWMRKSTSSVINVLAQALYTLFSAGSDINLGLLQKACFGYFKLGGRCVSTPMGLMAGIIHEPFTLIGHFFAVAFYSVWMILTTQPVYMLPFSMMRALMVLYTACLVIVPVLFQELF